MNPKYYAGMERSQGCIARVTVRTVLIVPLLGDSSPNQYAIGKCQRDADGNGVERRSPGARAQGSGLIVVLMLELYLSL